jgi:hypothetical protein
VIHTKLHELKLTAPNEEIVDAMIAAPKFVITDPVFELLYREDCKKAIRATVEAGIAHLPYNPVLIEFGIRASPLRHFVLFAEGADDLILAQAATLGDFERTTGRQEAVVVTHPTEIRIEKTADGRAAFGMTNWVDHDNSHILSTALSCAFLMLNIRGIDKEVIHTDKINRARAAKRDGRPPIPTHTIIRIGTIYDREGRGHAFDPSGRHMPVHLRSGYVRGQWFGKGREDYKQVFIPPCLVNYREEDASRPPRIPQKEVRV